MNQVNGRRMTVRDLVIQEIVRASEREEAALRRGDTIREFVPPQGNNRPPKVENQNANRTNGAPNNERHNATTRRNVNIMNPRIDRMGLIQSTIKARAATEPCPGSQHIRTMPVIEEMGHGKSEDVAKTSANNFGYIRVVGEKRIQNSVDATDHCHPDT